MKNKYKVIYDDFIIDVIDEPHYVKFLTKFNKAVKTDKTNANGVLSSDKKTIYVLQGSKCPEGKPYKTVKFIPIDDAEYSKLKERLAVDEVVYDNKQNLVQVRSQKLSELSNECTNNIVAGTYVLLSDNLYHHFKLTLEDQLNLSSIETDLKFGAKYAIYHSTGSVCEIYSYADMMKIIQETNKHKRYHTTYFNLLKYCINNMTNVDEISAIEYGVELSSLNIPTNIKARVQEILNG